MAAHGVSSSPPYACSTDQPSFYLCLRLPQPFCLELGVCSLRPGSRACSEGQNFLFSTIKKKFKN